MTNTRVTRLYARAALAAALLLLAALPARAQFRPRPLTQPATGEKYYIEAAANLWYPTANISVASEGSGALRGVVGTNIDAKNDLGLQDQRFPQLWLVLRPSTKHKIRAQYIPMKYEQTATPLRSLVFNGIRYSINVPVDSTLDWKAYRLGYEYDFVTTTRGFGGFIVEAKLTDVRVQLKSPPKNIDEFTRTRAPVPAIGGIARVYIVPNIAVSVEVTGFKFPKNIIKNNSGHYVDVDVYGTWNLTNNIGAQVGYRSLDLGYVIKTETGAFKLNGAYFGVVGRY